MNRSNVALTRLIDFALCVAMSSCLVYTVQGAFNIDEALHAHVTLTMGICCLLTGALCVELVRPHSKRKLRIGYAAVSIIACGAAIMLSPATDPVADTPENYLAATAIFLVVNAAVFFLSRRRLTRIVLLVVGSFTCGFVQFLYTTNMLLAMLVFLLCSLAMTMFGNYLDDAANASSRTNSMTAQALAVALAIPAATVLAALALVIGVIMPLDPPHATIKLMHEELAYEEEYVKGSVSLTEDADTTVTSSNVDESLEPRTTTDKKLDDTVAQDGNMNEEAPEQKKDYLSGEYSDVDFRSIPESVRTLALNPDVPWPLIIICSILALIALLILSRLAVHRIRLRRIMNMPEDERIPAFYRFFLSRFAKLGFGKPEDLSPSEYANMYRERLYPYVGAQEAGSFDHLTALFMLQEFAGKKASSEDLQAMRQLYNEFYRNCRAKLGLVGYGLKHFTL